MASHEADRAELGTASASASTDGVPGSRAEPQQVQDSTHQPTGTSQKDQKGELQVLGAIQILTGAMVLALGVLLGSLQYMSHLFKHFFLVFYTGYPLWGAALFISSGSLSVAAGRKPTRMLIQSSFGMNIASTTVSLVGFVFLSLNLVVNEYSLKGCQSSLSPDLCVYMGSSSNGLVSLMLLLTFLELCLTVTVSTMWCKENCCAREAISSSPNSV